MKNDRILICDATNSYIRIFTSTQHFSESGEFSGGIVGFLRSIGSNIRDFKPTRCILVFDGAGGSSRRKKLFPDYKGNRTGGNGMRMDLFQSVDEEKAAMRQQLCRIHEYLNHFPVEVICLDRIEADDTIAYCTMQYFKPMGSKVRIVSTDRDFLQLIDENIEVWSPVKKKLYTPESLYDEMKLTPTEYLTYRTVSGDTSDNINGVDGIGIKTLLKHFPNPTTIEMLLEESNQRLVSEKKPKQIFKKLVENKDILLRNYQLMQLQETDISGNSKLTILNLLDNPKSVRTNSYRIRKLMMEDGLLSTFKKLDEWLLFTFSNLNVWITS